MNGNNNKNALGKGLAALLGDLNYSDIDSDHAAYSVSTSPVNNLVPGKMQPRQRFDSEKMVNLIESIRDRGVLQPILVRKTTETDHYEIIAGERRWRASKEAGLSEVPIIVMDECSDQVALEIGLVENLQRDDLNTMEEAESLKKLIDDYGKTQDEVAKAISKSRSYVANLVRLNSLPDYVKDLIRNNKLSAGHARALIASENVDELVQQILGEKLSVRETEERARSLSSKQTKGTRVEKVVDPDLLIVAQKIEEALGLPTKIDITKNGGSIRLTFETYEQLDLVVCKLQSVGGVL